MDISIKITDTVPLTRLWIGDDGEGDYQIEAQPTWLTLERSDEDEIAIHAGDTGGGSPDASFYLTIGDALTLSALLAALCVREDAG